MAQRDNILHPLSPHFSAIYNFITLPILIQIAPYPPGDSGSNETLPAFCDMLWKRQITASNALFYVCVNTAASE